MTKHFTTLLFMACSLTCLSQLTFEPLLPPPPAPQIPLPEFDGVEGSSIAFADVDGDGSQDVLITGRNSSGQQVAKLYSNDGTGVYTEVIGTPFEGVYDGSIAFADVDNDGSQDVLITGLSSSGSIAKLYTNDGAGVFLEVAGTPFEGVSNGSIAFADIEEDGYQDVLITGLNSSGHRVAKLYSNDPTGGYTEVTGTVFEGVSNGSIAFADIESDGYQDVLITGLNSSGHRVAKLYSNDRMGVYTEVAGTPFEGVSNGSIAFADIEEDGYQDVLITGLNSSGQPVTKLYSNDPMGVYTEVAGTPFEGVSNGSIAFADIDGDGYQDVLITGHNGSQGIAKLYSNDRMGSYTEVTVTPFDGVRNSAVAFADIEGDGNQDVLITGLSISGSIAKLYTNDGTGDYTEVTDIVFEGVYSSSIAFADVDGDRSQDVLITGRNISNQPVAKLYSNDGTGGYTEVTGTPFEGVYSGSIAFADIDGDGDQDVLITGLSSSGSIAKLYTNNGAGVFSEVATPFEGVSYSSIAFADIDGNGSQDVLITGLASSGSIAKLYTNNGAGVFSEVATPFEGVSYSSIAFADIDGDGSQDVLITGYDSQYETIAKLYTNHGGNYTEVAGTPFDGIFIGSIAFADVDGDGSQDVLITGNSGSGIAKLYTNDGAGVFSEVATPFEGVVLSSIAFADIEGDGDQDVLITGYDSQNESIAKLYTNHGGNYTEVTSTPFDGVGSSSIAFADIDGDGSQDVLITGVKGSSYIVAQGYRNTTPDVTAPSFTSAATASLEENSTAVAYTATAYETVTFTLGSTKDEALFSLANDDEISFTSSPDYESPLDGNMDNDYLIDVTATDAAGNATTLEVTITVTDALEATWVGGSAGAPSDWATAANWSEGSVPTATYDVLIPDVTTDPIIDEDVEVKDLTIESGGLVTISTNTLTVNGNFINNQAAGLVVDNGASFVLMGTRSGATSATEKLSKAFIGDAALQIIASPLSSITEVSPLPDYAYAYDPSTSTFVTANITSPTSGAGFFTGFDASSPEVDFTGTIHSGQVDVTVVDGSGIGGDAFNLIGNPYAASIDAAAFFTANSSAVTGDAFLWNDGAGNSGGGRQGNYVTVNSAGTAGGPVAPSNSSGAGTTSKDPMDFDGSFNSFQGFFIQAASGGGMVSFTPSMQVVGDNGAASFFRQSVTRHTLRLAISNADVSDNILVVLDDNATLEADYSMDGAKFSGNELISFYASQLDDQYAITALPLVEEETMTLPLGFDLKEAGTYTLSVAEFENFPEGVVVMLHDAHTNQSYDLSEVSAVEFTTTASVAGDNRFSLSFARVQVVTSLENELKEIPLQVYGNTATLTINSDVVGESNVAIYTLSGRSIFKDMVFFENGEASITDLSLGASNVYILRVENQYIKFIVK